MRVSHVENRERSLELPQMRVRVQIRLLHHVLGLVIVAQHGPHGAIDALVVAAHQDLEERSVAGDDALDDLFVRQDVAEKRGGGVHSLH